MEKTLGAVILGLVLFAIGAGLGVVAVMQGWFGLHGAAENTNESAKKPPGGELESFLNLLAKAKAADTKNPSASGSKDQPPEPAVAIKKVAVMPFVIEDAYKGITEEKYKAKFKAEYDLFVKNLRKLLAANLDLTLIPAADVEALKDTKNLLEAGEKLGVDAIMTGQTECYLATPQSVTASLFVVKTGTYLWSNKFSAGSKESLTLVEGFHQIPGLITQELKLKLPKNK